MKCKTHPRYKALRQPKGYCEDCWDIWNLKNKPQQRTKKFYDYHECGDYLQKKYKYEERDYGGRYKYNKKDESKPYLDFWHWVLNNYEIHNGCFITFCKERLEEIEEDWVKEIYKHYLDEFADENGELTMFVWW